jgi:hypothetical protein
MRTKGSSPCSREDVRVECTRGAAFVGPKADEAAAASFEAHTTMTYAEYRAQRDDGLDNNEVLNEDVEGSEIYVLEPIICI